MNKPIYTERNYRYNITLFWRQFFPDYVIPDGHHVHHIYPKCLCVQDGWTDARINHPRNLIVVHPVEHLAIHLARGDRFIKEKFILEIAGNKRGKQSSATIEKRRKSTTGKKRTPEQRERMRQAQLNRKQKTPEEKAITARRISNAKKGIKLGPKSDEHKKKLSIAIKGKKKGPLSEETKQKMRKPKSEAHKRAISKGRIAKYAKT